MHHKTINTMGTYTITINEKTSVGKNLVAYLKSLGVIKQEDTTLKAIKEVKEGKTTHCKTFNDYLNAVK